MTAADSLSEAARLAQLDLVDFFCHVGLVVVVIALGVAALHVLDRLAKDRW